MCLKREADMQKFSDLTPFDHNKEDNALEDEEQKAHKQEGIYKMKEVEVTTKNLDMAIRPQLRKKKGNKRKGRQAGPGWLG